MSAPFPTAGLRTEQAPPLSIPATFFVTAPLAIAAAGVWLAITGTAPAARWLPITLAVTHLLTLGLLAAVMWGALYQMTPVVAGAPVPGIRLAHLVHVLLASGVAALATGLSTGSRTAMWAAVALLGAAVTAFVVPLAIALVRAPTRHHTVTGMRIAVSALAVLAALGLMLAMIRTGTAMPLGHAEMLSLHVGLGLVVWVGGLITAVSWQVVPMFYLAEELPPWSRRVDLACLALALASPLLLAWSGRPPWLVPLAMAPAAVSVWLLQPVLVLRAIARRRRKRADPSKGFWQIGMACAPPTLALAAATVLLDDARWPVLFGWLALWGWAATTVHGMLTRIVPFLVWFHRFSALVGRAPVPPMRRMIPDRWVRTGRALHVASLLLGVGAIVADTPLLTRVFGLTLLATAITMTAWMVRVLRRRPEPAGT